MRPYNLNIVNHEIAGKEIPVIRLGEGGRNRKQSLVLTDSPLGESVNVKFPRLGSPGRPRIINDPSAPEGWVARVCTHRDYRRGAWGHVSAPDSVKLVSKGIGAYGIAGNCGQWDDVLLIIPIGGYVKVTPSRGSDYVLLFDEQVHTLEVEEADLIGLDLENLAEL